MLHFTLIKVVPHSLGSGRGWWRNGLEVEEVRVLRICCRHTCPATPGCLEAPSHRRRCAETQNYGWRNDHLKTDKQQKWWVRLRHKTFVIIAYSVFVYNRGIERRGFFWLLIKYSRCGSCWLKRCIYLFHKGCAQIWHFISAQNQCRSLRVINTYYVLDTRPINSHQVSQ